MPSPVPELQVRDAWFSYAGAGRGKAVLRGLNLSIPRGEATVVMGPNGCGKTTLLRILAGVARPDRGSLVHANGSGARGGVGYIPQQVGLVKTRTARENVLMGALSRVSFAASALGIWPAEEEDRVDALLARVGLAEKADRKAHELSGGERQRIAIARALMQRPKVLVADEFVSNLDVVKAGQVLDLTRELRKEGTTLVLALHSLDLALEYGDRVVFLKDGLVEAEYEAPALTVEVAKRHLAA